MVKLCSTPFVLPHPHASVASILFEFKRIDTQNACKIKPHLGLICFSINVLHSMLLREAVQVDECKI